MKNIIFVNICHCCWDALLQCIDNIYSCSHDNEFKFSLPKCNAMHFNILPGLHLNPVLKLDNHNVEYCKEIKFLVLTWDMKH